MHAEVGEVVARGEAGGGEFFAGLLDGRLLDDQFGAVDAAGRFDRAASEGAEGMEMALERGLDAGDGVAHVLLNGGGAGVANLRRFAREVMPVFAGEKRAAAE